MGCWMTIILLFFHILLKFLLQVFLLIILVLFLLSFLFIVVFIEKLLKMLESIAFEPIFLFVRLICLKHFLFLKMKRIIVPFLPLFWRFTILLVLILSFFLWNILKNLICSKYCFDYCVISWNLVELLRWGLLSGWYFLASA